MTGRKGFSLIEIIVVVAILVFLTCIAIPIFSNLVQQGAGRAAQNNLLVI